MRNIILKTAIFSLGSALCLFPGPNAARALDHAPQARQETPQFFELLEDIPLMPGLQELPDETLSFDKPEGRIVEAAALMRNLTREQILLYYQSVLPRFGWGQSGESSFFRTGEVLRLSFDEDHDGRRIARFLIKPVL